MSERVFVSHSAKDRHRISAVLDTLRAGGVEIWIAPDDVPAGSDYSEVSDDAIQECSAFIIFVSEAAGRSRHVRAETQLAFTSGKPIYPIRLDDEPIARGLRLFLNVQHFTDAFGPGSAASVQRLIRTLQGAKAGSPPPREDYAGAGAGGGNKAAGSRGLLVALALGAATATGVAVLINQRAAPEPVQGGTSSGIPPTVSEPQSPAPDVNTALPTTPEQPRQTAIDLIRGEWDLVESTISVEDANESSCARPDRFVVEPSGTVYHQGPRFPEIMAGPFCIVDHDRYSISAIGSIPCEGIAPGIEPSSTYRLSTDGNMLIAINGRSSSSTETYRRCR